MMQSYLPGGLAAATKAALPISRRARPSVGYFDLQIIRSSPQVKTAAGVAFAVLGHISLGFKQLARPLHVAALLRVSCVHDGLGFAAALLAASTVIRISYGSEGWRRIGVGFRPQCSRSGGCHETAVEVGLPGGPVWVRCQWGGRAGKAQDRLDRDIVG